MNNLITLFNLFLIIIFNNIFCQVFIENFNSSEISSRWGYELASPDRMSIVPNPNGIIGDSSLELQIMANDLIGTHSRSEVKIFNEDSLGSLVEYRFSAFIPIDFVDSLPSPHNRHMIMQFHQRFVPGSSWSTCNCGDEPVFSINLRKYNNSKYLLSARYGKNGFEGTEYLNNFLVASDTLEIEDKGKWINFVLRIKWSLDSDGYIELWKNNIPWTNFNGTDYKFYGANMWNYVPCSFKMGLYRAPGNPTTNKMLFDNFYIKNNLSNCSIPTENFVTEIQSNSAIINCEFIPEAIHYVLIYRELGSLEWNYKTISTQFHKDTINNLLANTEYEYRIKSYCSSSNKSIFSNIKTFKTLPICGIPTNFEVNEIDAQSTLISWDSIENEDYYIIQYKLKNSSTWIFKSAQSNQKIISDLIPNSIYEYKVKTYCGIDSVSIYSNKNVFCFNCEVSLLNKLNFDFKIFPNPIQTTCSIIFNTTLDEIVNYKVYDLFGNSVFNGSVSINEIKNSINLDFSTIVNGFYICEISNKNFSEKFTAIVQH